ncbi:helix-turn-helix transcriptional regulator [Empedobacter brevis]|uniref:Helix-turn-helix transcriptional regulator n=1 Tax=Empedobacter brevis TaxID=247 RepID=A0AAJ1QCR6_9FLAO|nr:AraC family transcriptional regulator [Empedobacter brevis]MDM1071669.1 helix-turn-helix transcriptional regulator [Empedobacter brevis]QHC85880.1 hypothetical protein AS589_14340 [Empedobacter brevis]
MKHTIQNKVHIENSWGLFVGELNDNILHRHYALQITVTSNQEFRITDKNNKQNSYKACFINNNIEHQLNSSEISLIILINPISCIGHQFHNNYKNAKIVSLKDDFHLLSNMLDEYLQNNSDFNHLAKNINRYLTNFKCQCERENHFDDNRIYNTIAYLERNSDRVVSLKEIAAFCFLSETRFLHLFKEKTNINFRRYQLWNRLIKSLPYLKTHSITETSHQFGFTDSSHYNRTFKETFGLSPKFLSSLK